MKNLVVLLLFTAAPYLNAFAQFAPSHFETLKSQQNTRGEDAKRPTFKKSTGLESSVLNDLKHTEQQNFIVQKMLQEKSMIRRGGGDAGGGNLIDGRPIENFAVDISRTPEMIQALKVANLIGAVKFESLNKIIKSILEKKTWYLVPVSLPKLSENQIGTPFASTQGALQDFEEIWIDINKYEKMNFKEKVTLLVHEIFMGIKIFKFESYYKQCTWSEPFNEDCLKFQNYNVRRQLLITESDYQDIRRLAAQLSKNYEKLVTTSFIDEHIEKISTLVFENGGFDSYFIKPSGANIAQRNFTGQDILNSINNQASIHGFPKYCKHKIVEDLGNHQYLMRAETKANIEHNVENENVIFKVRLLDKKTNKNNFYNTYTYNIEKQSTESLTLGFDLNQPAYHFQRFVKVESKTFPSQNIGIMTIGLTPSLNIRSLTFATFNAKKGENISFYNGRDVFKCMEKEEYICTGPECIE